MRRSYTVSVNTDNRFQINDLTIDFDARRVLIGETDLHLTRTEFAIISNSGPFIDDAIVTHDELITQVWGED